MYKSLGPNSIPHMRDFSSHRAVVIVRSILTGRSSLEESKWHSYLQEGQRGDLVELQANQPDFISGKVMEQLISEIIWRHKDAKVIRGSQQAFTKRKSCLMNQTAFNNETIGLIDEGRSVIVIFLDFISVFDTVSYKILTENLMTTRDGPLRMLRDWSMLRSGTLEKQGSGNLNNTYKYLASGVHNEHEARLFFCCPVMGKKGTVHNLEHRRLSVSARTHFFTLGLIELGTYYPQIQRNHFPWKYSKAVRIGSVQEASW